MTRVTLLRQPLRGFYFWLLVGWLFVCWVAYQSLTPSPIQTPGVKFGDKLGHFSAYFLMMAWFAQLYMRRSHVRFLVFFIFLGIVIEILQGQTTYRLFEYADMVANALGATVAWLLAGSSLGFAKLLQRLERVL